MTLDLTKISFYSNLNYLKRTEFTGSFALTLGGSGVTTTHVVEHNLGYVPFFIVGAHINDDTVLWSNNRVHTRTQSASPTDIPTNLNYWCTDTELTIAITNGTGAEAQTGVRQIYWSIYLDQ